MKKRVTALLMLSIVLATAPAAMAQCVTCRPINHTCPPVTSGGFTFCYWLGPDCIVGEWCGVAASAQPLASEYQVASVERADEPQADSDQTRIALSESAPESAPEPAPASAVQR